MKRTNYQKKQITGKETHLILSLEAYKALNQQKEKLNIKSTTSIIELLLLSTQNKDNTHIPNHIVDDVLERQQKVFNYITNLINFNKKLYIDINATFSNINQIAYRLNLANLNNTLDSVNTKELHQEVIQTLSQTREDLTDLKFIMKNLIKILKTHEKTFIKIKKGKSNDQQ